MGSTFSYAQTVISDTALNFRVTIVYPHSVAQAQHRRRGALYRLKYRFSVGMLYAMAIPPNAVFDRKNSEFRIQDSEYNGKDILVLSAATTQRDDFLALKQLVFLEVVAE